MAAFANLSEADRELLEMLAEDALEAAHAVMKTLRHGLDSWNPDKPEAGNNSTQIAAEIGQLLGLLDEATKRGLVDMREVEDERAVAWAKKLRYAHHQN